MIMIIYQYLGTIILSPSFHSFVFCWKQSIISQSMIQYLIIIWLTVLSVSWPIHLKWKYVMTEVVLTEWKILKVIMHNMTHDHDIIFFTNWVIKLITIMLWTMIILYIFEGNYCPPTVSFSVILNNLNRPRAYRSYMCPWARLVRYIGSSASRFLMIS